MKRLSMRRKGVGGLASRALGWSFLNTAVARFGTLGIGIMLARLLGPHAFGTFAVAYVALLAVLSFNELGVSLAIVRWEGEPGEIVPTVATISTITSIIIYIGSYLAAPVFAHAMGAPAATTVIRVLAINVIIDGAVSAPAALMQRQFRQDKKMIADQANTWVGAVVSIGLAWERFGAMSIAIGRLAGALVAAVLIGLFARRGLRFGFDRTKARALLRFGLPLAGASIVVLAVGQVDQVVVGRMLGPTALGFYALAFNLSSWPVNMFSVPIRSVAPAVFSRLQHDPGAMRKGFLSSVGLLGSVTLPVCLVISGAAVPIIHVVYGVQWTSAARALVWLALLGALRILFEFVYDFFVVLARSRVVFTVQLAWLFALIPALIAGVRIDGIAGAGIAEVAVATCVVVPWYLSELRRVDIKRRTVAAQLWLPLLVSAVLGLVAATAARLVPNDIAACAISAVIALAVIGLLLYWKRPALAELLPLLRTSARVEPNGRIDRAAMPVPAGVDRRLVSGVGPAAVYGGRQAAALQALLAISVPMRTYADLTGPLPIYRDPTWDSRVQPEVREFARRGVVSPSRERRVPDLQPHMQEPEAVRGRSAMNGRKGRHARLRSDSGRG